MKNTTLARNAHAHLVRTFGSIALAALLIFSMAACDDTGGSGSTGNGNNAPDLPGSIAIYPDTGVTTGDQLTAYYDGDETVTFQWKMGGSNVGAASTDNPNTYTPEESGSYTVTVSAEGYKNKTSAAVTVTGATLPDLEGDVTVSPSTGVITGTKLTATYSGSEWVSYQWKNGANAVGTDSNEYTPTEEGSYTVTVSAYGYKSKTSTAVTVTAPLPWVWTTVTTSTFTYILSIAYGDNKWVAGGSNGKMAYSTDNGVTWTAASADHIFGSTNNDRIESIAYGGGRWVAVSSGGDGKMAYSDDGKTWTAVAFNTFGTNYPNYISGIAYGNGRWVAVGGNGKMAYSDDGETWTKVADSTFSTTNSHFTDIAYGNGRFVAVGSSTSSSAACSADGETWTKVNVINGFVPYSVTCGDDGRWIVAGNKGEVSYSDDCGETWTMTKITDGAFGTNYITRITYGNGRWVAYCNRPAYTDDNGETWTILPAISINNIAYGNGRFIGGVQNRISYADY
jgi:hypothetical protein